MIAHDLKDEEKKLFDLVPPGKAIGNKALRKQLGWDNLNYFAVRNRLVERGILVRGRGKGGSVYRGSVPTAPPEVQSPEEVAREVVREFQREQDLYPKMRKVLETDWAHDQGLPEGGFLVEVTGAQGAKVTGGKWSRPDITVVAVHVYDLLPTKHLEVTTFEVKPSDSWDITSVFEAAAHSRAATRSFLAIHTPKGPPTDTDNWKRIVGECQRFGIGLVTFDNPADFDTYDVNVDPDRRVPDPYELNQFLHAQLPPASQDRIRRWLK